MFKAKKVNDSFFDKIDNEEKAYLLGFFMADGHLGVSNKKNISKSMVVSLSIRDKEILENFIKYVCPEATLQTYVSNIKYKDNIYPHNTCKIQWTSEHMGEVLTNNYGITSNKSTDNSLTFPDIDPGLNRHFVRGFMDGDGTVKKTKTSPAISFVCTSEKFIKKLENILLSEVGGSSYLTLDIKDRKTPLWRLYLYSYSKENYPGNKEYAKQVKNEFYKKLYNYLYKNSNLFLTRKRDRFSEFHEIPS